MAVIIEKRKREHLLQTAEDWEEGAFLSGKGAKAEKSAADTRFP